MFVNIVTLKKFINSSAAHARNSSVFQTMIHILHNFISSIFVKTRTPTVFIAFTLAAAFTSTSASSVTTHTSAFSFPPVLTSIF